MKKKRVTYFFLAVFIFFAILSVGSFEALTLQVGQKYKAELALLGCGLALVALLSGLIFSGIIFTDISDRKSAQKEAQIGWLKEQLSTAFKQKFPAAVQFLEAVGVYVQVSELGPVFCFPQFFWEIGDCYLIARAIKTICKNYLSVQIEIEDCRDKCTRELSRLLEKQLKKAPMQVALILLNLSEKRKINSLRDFMYNALN